MYKFQYQCIKTALSEVDAYKKDGYDFISKYSTAGGWWMSYMKHPNGNTIMVEMNAGRNELRVYLNGNLKKCQKFGV